MPNYHFGDHPAKHELHHSGASGVAALLQCSYQREPKTEVIKPNNPVPLGWE
jgi:hypothetical protein